MRSVRRVRLAVLSGMLAALLTPSAAVAEGPGYGGNAHQLGVRWKSKKSKKRIVIAGVGFRAHSRVLLRMGDADERRAVADETGTVRAVVDTGEQRARLASGSSVLAVGQTPGGTTLTLVGFVPSESDDDLDLAGWALPAIGALVLARGALVRRKHYGSKR
ncbi:MAG: hypothetical protein HKP61_11335 [Dactylosporangium sp.]|nr:hypothetical protein [Dactylosporangium sp.]NNJ61519.1 hypothetical protein [Dactylosporangium sp.]